MMDFTGKNVLVTGGSRGIGRAIAQGFAERGARVALSYLTNRQAADETIAALPGGPHLAIQADVSDPESARRLIDEAAQSLGRLDILVNNAGMWLEHLVEEVDFDGWQDAWRRTLDTNLVGPANLAYLAARHMIEHGGGRIVNVSSRGAFRGEPRAPAYGASKAGLNARWAAIGARLTLHRTQGKRLVRTLRAGEGFLSQSSKRQIAETGSQGSQCRSPRDRAGPGFQVWQSHSGLLARCASVNQCF